MTPKDRIIATAAKAARRYARKVWWADEDDLRQEAALAALQATREGGPYDPETGVPVGAYVWRACVLHLRAYLWQQSAPVNETDHKLATLRGVHRLELNESLASADVDAYELLSEKEWTEEVRSQLDYLLNKRGAGKHLARVLLNEESPTHVAHEAGIPIDDLYILTKKTRRDIASNAYLFHLLRNR